MAKMTLTISPDVAASGSQYRACTSFIEFAHTFAVINERSTKVESQAVCAVDDEEEERETGTMPDRSLEVDKTALFDVGVVQIGEDVLSAERLSRTDGREDFFRKRAAFGDVLEGKLHVLGDEPVHDTTCNSDTRQDGRHGEGETPAPDIRKNETGDEGRKEVDDHGNFL